MSTPLREVGGPASWEAGPDTHAPGTLPVVLVVDDEVQSQHTLRRVLEEDFDVLTVSGVAEAEGVLASEWVDVLLCDQRMPGEQGVDFLARVRERWPEVVRMIISGYTNPDDIICGVNEAGIYQYITKPWNPEQLILTVRGAAELSRLQRENELLGRELKVTAPVAERAVQAKRERLRSRFDFATLVRAPGSPLDAVCDLARRVAAYDISLLLTGESGTGKELLARAVHQSSPRAGKPFVVENCGALPDELLESELFGCRKGAFTGAYEDRLGLFAQADGGTMFLDEIGDVTPAFQVKLLRVLQEGEIRPLGGARPRRVDVRVIAATNKDLEAEVRAGRFREDLYYRLAGFTLHVPPLRERPADVEILATRLLEDASRAFGKAVDGFTAQALACLCGYRWPGNVRELHNEVRRMLALSDGARLGVDLMRPAVREAGGTGAVREMARTSGGGLLRERVEALERGILLEALERHGGNRTRVAEDLGLSRVGLRAKLRRHGLDGDGEDAGR